jgi:hypothetical protein
MSLLIALGMFSGTTGAGAVAVATTSAGLAMI